MPRLILASSLRNPFERSPLVRWALWRLEASIAAALSQLTAWLPPDRASAAGRRLMRRIGPRLYKTEHFTRNLALAFPEKTEAEIKTLVRELWGNIGAVLAEYAHLGVICGQEADERIETKIEGELKVLRERDKGAVFVAPHLGNWEITAAAIARLGVPLKVVYAPMQNPLLDRMLRNRRQSLGCGLVNKQDGPRAMVRQLASGGSIGILADRRTEQGEPLPFLGSTMHTTVTPARLALRFGCELIPARIERLTGARFRMTLHEPIRPDSKAADERHKVLEMTAKMNALFEAWIRERPHEWFCSNFKPPKKAAPGAPVARGLRAR